MTEDVFCFLSSVLVYYNYAVVPHFAYMCLCCWHEFTLANSMTLGIAKFKFSDHHYEIRKSQQRQLMMTAMVALVENVEFVERISQESHILYKLQGDVGCLG